MLALKSGLRFFFVSSPKVLSMALENGQFEKFGSFGAVFPLKMTKLTRVRKNTYMGRNGPTAKTKTVLKTACKSAQLWNMQNLTNPNFQNKNHPTSLASIVMMNNSFHVVSTGKHLLM